MENNTSFTESIKKHLDAMAMLDKAFAAKYADKTKNLNACIKYITERARKRAIEGVAVIRDDIVFGWAVHYYQEKDIKPEKAVFAEVKTSPHKVTPVVPCRKTKKVVKKPIILEGNLFNF